MSRQVLSSSNLLDVIANRLYFEDLASLARVNQAFLEAASARLYRCIDTALFSRLSGPSIEYSRSPRRDLYLDSVRCITYRDEPALYASLPIFQTSLRRKVAKLHMDRTIYPYTPLSQDSASNEHAQSYIRHLEVDLVRMTVDDWMEAILVPYALSYLSSSSTALKGRPEARPDWSILIPQVERRSYPVRYTARRLLRITIAKTRKEGGKPFIWTPMGFNQCSISDLGSVPHMFSARDPDNPRPWLEAEGLVLPELDLRKLNLSPAEFRIFGTVPGVSRLTLTVPKDASEDDLLAIIKTQRPVGSEILFSTINAPWSSGLDELAGLASTSQIQVRFE